MICSQPLALSWTPPSHHNLSHPTPSPAITPPLQPSSNPSVLIPTIPLLHHKTAMYSWSAYNSIPRLNLICANMWEYDFIFGQSSQSLQKTSNENWSIVQSFSGIPFLLLPLANILLWVWGNSSFCQCMLACLDLFEWKSKNSSFCRPISTLPIHAGPFTRYRS